MWHEDRWPLDKPTTPPHDDTLTNFTGPWNQYPLQPTSSFTYTLCTEDALTPKEGCHGCLQVTYGVGLLCACSHMALGILVGLDQQLDKAGNDRCLLQWGMVGWAQGQISDKADGCLAGERAAISGTSWASRGPVSQFQYLLSLLSPLLPSRPERDTLCDLQRTRPLPA